MKLVIVGATGLVGRKILQVLAERNLPINELMLAASEKSAGSTIDVGNQKIKILSVEEAIEKKPDFAIFSAGGEVSKKYAPLFAENNCVVIDNSSAWRMDKSVPLIVPEINGGILTKDQKIIANPNCSTIQLLMAIAPLHLEYKIDRMVLSTYQSVTGSGVDGVNQLIDERNNKSNPIAYPHNIDMNLIPHGGKFNDNGYTDEELKLLNESRKILNQEDLKITSTVVRVPVTGGHSISANISFKNDFTIKKVIELLHDMDGVIVMDDVKNNVYPMPKFAYDKDEVFVGRIRRDFSAPNSLNMWIVADNLRKGAATNAVQIAEYMMDKFKKDS